MKARYECQPYVFERALTPLIFDWDADEGKVEGPGATHIMEQIALGGVTCHPDLFLHEFGPTPLKSPTDIAAIIGERWNLPDNLIDFYPQIEEPEGLPPGAIVG